MFILVDRAFAVSLQEPDDLKAFKVVVCQPREALPRLAGALRGVAGTVDEAHCWIHESWLRRQEAVAADPVWQSGFDKVMVYARTKGWVDDVGGTVRAHVEWRDEAGDQPG